MKYGPVTVAVTADVYFQAYINGIFDRHSSGVVNHAVVLVGWDDDRNCWLLRNSWGTDWGIDGHMCIKYGTSSVGHSAAYVIYNEPQPSPYGSFSLQPGTALQETGPNQRLLLASNNDLFFIAQSGTGSHSTEVHVLSAASMYQQFIEHTGTPLHETDESFQFALAQNRDLFIIKQRATGTKRTELHVLSAASRYQRYILQLGTALGETGSTVKFLVASNRDLFAILQSQTGTGTTEVHVLSAVSQYQRFIMQTGTALHPTDSTFQFALAPNRDLYVIKQSRTGTQSTEVHVLSSASNYRQFSLHTGTALQETGSSVQFQLSARKQLYTFLQRNTGTHTTEVHVLNAA